MDIYFACLLFSLFVVAGLQYGSYKSSTVSSNKNNALNSFQKTYLLVYALAFFGDWLQGPYVYALYSSYGFKNHDIAILFVAGFGSSMVFGTFVGSLADKMGRKKFSLLYCFVYILSCLTKHSASYNTLMIGRLLGGVATSLLFSVLESWMIAEHNSRGFDPEALGDTFSKATFVNAVVAILSGFLANYVADFMPLSALSGSWYYGGNTGPFDLAALFLLACAFLIQGSWGENVGSHTLNVAASSGISSDAIKNAVAAIRSDSRIFLIGSMCALFEGSMYTFVFLWTPMLESCKHTGEKLPFGIIFSVLMVSCMGGSTAFRMLAARMEVVRIASLCFLAAAVSLALPYVNKTLRFGDETVVNMVCFMAFEGCVGLYWPALGTLKGIYVPESQRSAIYNVFRVPLNAIVLFVLMYMSDISPHLACVCCSVLLTVAYALNNKLQVAIRSQSLQAIPLEEDLEADHDDASK